MGRRRCVICGAEPVKAHDRCATCYQYRRRNGTDRDPEAIAEANLRAEDAELEAERIRAIARWS